MTSFWSLQKATKNLLLLSCPFYFVFLLVLIQFFSLCIIQENLDVLFSECLENFQKKYWSKLKAQQKIAIMDILFSLIEFAASYNSYSNLMMRMHKIPAERSQILLKFVSLLRLV